MEAYLPFSGLLAQLKRLLRPWLIIAAAAGVIVVAVYALTMPGRGHVTATVNYSYDGVESGVDPSGNHFDPAQIKSAVVLRRAADELEMQLSDEDIERIRGHITVIGSVPSEAFERTVEHSTIYGEEEISTTAAVRAGSYYPTQYEVSFDYKAAGYSGAEAERLLNAMLTSYETYFYEQYGYNAAIEQSVYAIDYTEYDYDNALEVLDNRLVLLRGYLNRLADEDYTRFQSEATGYSFSDLIGAIDTIRAENIELASSYIVSNNVSKSRRELIDYYNYRIEASERERTVLQDRLSALDILIEGYAKTNVLVLSAGTVERGSEPTGYEVSQQSDMYDSLINQRVECRTSLSETEEEINLYRTRVERLNGAGTVGSAAVVEEYLKEIDAKVRQLLADTNATASEYFKTVRLKRAFQVLDITSGLSLGNLARYAFLNVAAAETLIFGAYLLCAVVQARSPKEIRVKLKWRKARNKPAQPDRHV